MRVKVVIVSWVWPLVLLLPALGTAVKGILPDTAITLYCELFDTLLPEGRGFLRETHFDVSFTRKGFAKSSLSGRPKV